MKRAKVMAPLPEILDRGRPVSQQHRNDGKALRERCPRSSQADLGRPKGHRDPQMMLRESNKGRIGSLVPVRHSRMMESPFAFFRGSAIVQASDLSGTPSTGICVQLCGDCHLMNFGGFATPERQLIFDINDFDETFPGPWEWDVKRLCVSLVLAARWRGFDKAAALDAANTAVARYRKMINAYADMPTMDVWHSDISFADMLRAVGGNRRLKSLLDADVRRAQHSNSEHVYGKITHEVADTVQIVDQPPFVNAGEKMHRRTGVKMHHGRAASWSAAFQFD
jgi:hypothetical protein